MVHSLEWLRKKREMIDLKHSLEHLNKVRETVHALHKAIRGFGNKDSLMELLHDVANKEHEADVIRKDLTLEIAKGNLVFAEYEDLLEFVYLSDSIADRAHAADRYLALFDGTFTADVKTRLERLAEIGCKCVDCLCTVVEKLATSSREEVLAGCAQIETLEETADDEKRELLRAIFHATYSTPQLILLRDLAESVEDICDRCEIVSDRLRIMAVRL